MRGTRASALAELSQLSSSSQDKTLGDLGEKALLRRLLPLLRSDDRLVTGIGHDAAVVDLGSEVSRLALKIDRAARPVAVSSGWSDMSAWGRMAVTANCSDLLATGAIPRAFMLSVTLPRQWPERDFVDLVLGAEAECRSHDVSFSGGDTKEGVEPVVVGTAVGLLAGRPYSRAGARAGDQVLIAGDVGGFLGAYLLLAEGVAAHANERAAWIAYLSRPVARWNEGLAMVDQETVQASVDTSDGIYDAFIELTREDLGIHLDLASIPFHPFAHRCARELKVPLRNFLFAGGDWNLVYAVQPGWSAASHGLERLSLRVIGEFTADRKMCATLNGSKYEFSGPRGEHFRTRLEDGGTFTTTVIEHQWFSELGDPAENGL
jgi:thiamine-monophosphate kinase